METGADSPPDAEQDVAPLTWYGKVTTAAWTKGLITGKGQRFFAPEEQITRTTPRRRTILHLSQIRFTDALTFIVSRPLMPWPPRPPHSRRTIRPRKCWARIRRSRATPAGGASRGPAGST